MPGLPLDSFSQVKKVFKSVFRKNKGSKNNGESSNSDVTSQHSNPPIANNIEAQKQQTLIPNTAQPEIQPLAAAPEAGGAEPSMSAQVTPSPLQTPQQAVGSDKDAKEEKTEEALTQSTANNSTTKKDTATAPENKPSSSIEREYHVEKGFEINEHVGRTLGPVAKEEVYSNKAGPSDAVPGMTATSGPLEDNPVPM